MNKIKTFLMLMILCSTLVFAKDDSLKQGMMPKFYKERSHPILNIALVYYGDYYSATDLARVQALLEERFFLSTDKSIKLNTAITAIMPFKNQLADFPEYRQEYVTDPVRLQRLWYYDNVGANIVNEVYEQVRHSPILNNDLSNIDALIIITGAQFDALGFASGRVAVTENPMEIAWALPDGGSVDYVSDAKVVDELIHELGHVMFLDHAASQCFKPDLSDKESAACCEASPAKNDVMSYCRKRSKVDEEHFYKYEACNLRTIREKIIPAMLSGGKWNIENREKCL
jgi:hypothetical protein